MRIASFNIENLFERPKAMNLDTWADGKAVLADFKRLNELIQEPVYTNAFQQQLLDLLSHHTGLRTNGESRFLRLREIRGRLASRTSPEIIADGRADWIGWFELKTEAVKATATENTARICGLLHADVLCVVEADNRTALNHFNADVFPKVNVDSYGHIMLIDGNDDRGIDLGILTRREYGIARIVSHVDDEDDDGLIFSRDCAEYEIRTPQGNSVLLLLNHFKSKGYGNAAESAAKRLRQATRVRAIYDERIADGYEYVAVVGDMNETPDAEPMKPLVDSPLTDVMAHPTFVPDGRPGTYANGTAANKLDYILMSPKLSEKVLACGIERKGVWGGQNGTLFPHLATIVKKVDAASDHAALWVDVEI